MSLEKCIFGSSAHFKIRLIGVPLFCFAIKLYELYIEYEPFIQYTVSKYFLPFHGCLFILLIVSIALQKLFTLNQSNLFSFAFVASAFGITLKKIKK